VVVALKSALWLLVPVALLAGCGFAIYLLVIATDLERLAAVGLIEATMLCRSGFRWHQDAGFSWTTAGLLLAVIWRAAQTLARRPGWPASRVHALAHIGTGLFLVSLVCLGVATVILARSGIRSWRTWRVRRRSPSAGS
jgi:hypothetical protein